MERTKILAKRIKEVLLDGHWIANTNYKEQIENLTWIEARQKIGNLNTIAALIYHVNYYIHGLIKVFNGGELEISDKYSFDLAPIESETDWEKLRDEFLQNSQTFITEVTNMPDNELDEPFVNEKYGTNLRNIEGVIEHCYYHLGQVSLIKKMLKENNASTPLN
jgi:uncharacterized damage-inducible protein DinB